MQRLLARGATLVEVLPAEEYAEEHIAGAMNIPLKELRREADGIARSDPIVVYCHDSE